MWRTLCILGLCLSCTRPDPQTYLSSELAYLHPGVQLDSEEKEVRRVLGQRGLRIDTRVVRADYVALGAATRDQRVSAVRIISRRGVVLAEDAALDDLFGPAKVVLLEHFGGTFGDYELLAVARLPLGRDAGCVSLYRILPNGDVLPGVLDVSALGSRACVSNLARAGARKFRATVAWPGLHVLATPQLDVELVLAEPLIGHAPTPVPVAKLAQQGDWLDAEHARLSTLKLARASFSERHAAGVARAALASFTGHDLESQLAAYRHAVGAVPPGSTESDVVADTTDHISRGWLDPVPASDAEGASPTDEVVDDPALDDGSMLVEPNAQ